MLCVVFFYDYDYAQIGNEKKLSTQTLPVFLVQVCLVTEKKTSL